MLLAGKTVIGACQSVEALKLRRCLTLSLQIFIGP